MLIARFAIPRCASASSRSGPGSDSDLRPDAAGMRHKPRPMICEAAEPNSAIASIIVMLPPISQNAPLAPMGMASFDDQDESAPGQGRVVDEVHLSVRVQIE